MCHSNICAYVHVWVSRETEIDSRRFLRGEVFFYRDEGGWLRSVFLNTGQFWLIQRDVKLWPQWLRSKHLCAPL